MAKCCVSYKSLGGDIQIDITYSHHKDYFRTANTYSINFIKSNLSFENAWNSVASVQE